MSLKSFFSDISFHSHWHHLFSVRSFFFIGFFVHCGCHCYCFFFISVHVYDCVCVSEWVSRSNGFVYFVHFGLRFFAIRFYSASPHISILLLFWKCCYVQQHNRRDNHCCESTCTTCESKWKTDPFRKR